MFQKNKKYRIDQHQKNKILDAFYHLNEDINSKQVEVFKGMYSNGSIYFEPGGVYAYVNDVIIANDPETNKTFYITPPTTKLHLAGIYLNTYTYRSHVEGIFQIDERDKKIPIQSDIHGFFFIKLGYLTGSIFQKSTINSINPTDAENVLAESYSNETGETGIYANPNEPMQIAIPIVPERGGSRKKRLRKKKSKTKKNKKI